MDSGNDRNHVDATNTDCLDEIKYIRVTDVLTPFTGLDKAPQYLVENAAQRGKRVHTACEGILKGLDVIEFDDEIKPYVDSFNLWWAEKPAKVIAIERRFFCNELRLTGQVDMILEDDDGLTVVDLKTSYSPSKTWPLQGSAYKYLATLNGYPIQSIKFIHLNRLGKHPKVHIYKDQWDMYKKCLDVFKYFHTRMQND